MTGLFHFACFLFMYSVSCILWLNNIVWTNHILFIHLSADGRLDCFHLLTIMNNAGINIHIQVLVWASVFISLENIYLGTELLGHMVATFEGLSGCFPEQLHHLTFPAAGHEGSDFSTSPSPRLQVVSPHGFDLYFLDD